MQSASMRNLAISMTLALGLTAVACGHKAAPAVPTADNSAPAAPGAAAPTVTLKASPTSVERGGQSTLTWTSQNAVRVELNGTAVNLNDSQPVTPTASTDYQMVARSADNKTATAAVHITVTEPAGPVTAPVANETPIGADALFTQNVRDAFFDYDKSDIRPDAQQALQADASFLKSHPDISVSIEGHCDDRGSAEYNLALGDRRANAAKNFLVGQGVDASRVTAVSVGKEKPFCTQDTDDCWQQNRVGHLMRQQ